jgi:hypothetical protein
VDRRVTGMGDGCTDLMAQASDLLQGPSQVLLVLLGVLLATLAARSLRADPNPTADATAVPLVDEDREKIVE